MTVAIDGDSSIFVLVCYTLIYTAWYNVILLSESGLGFLEWGLVFFALVINFLDTNLRKVAKAVPSGQTPLTLMIFGFTLYIAKLFLFYMTSGAIYESAFLGNTTAKVFLIAGVIICSTMAIKTLINRAFSKKDLVVNKPSKTLMVKNTLISGAKALGNTIAKILRTFSLPALIATAAIAFIFALLFTKSVVDDIEKFFQPILEKILTTGENTITPSAPYNVLQFIVFALIAFYTIHINNKLTKATCNQSYKKIQVKMDSEMGEKSIESDIKKEPYTLDSSAALKAQVLDTTIDEDVPLVTQK